ncbi:AAA family ATPase [Streptomyces sp. NPDC059875]|uniref:AAA family ATPase n=1 Tax=unclassified Streptomyces TaxID=2593676 RepID=UPI00364CA7D4
MQAYTDGTALVLGLARIEARAVRSSHVGPEHLLLALTKLCRSDLGRILEASRMSPSQRAEIGANAQEIRRGFERAAIDPHLFRRRLRAVLETDAPALAPAPPPEAGPPRSPAARDAFVRAGEIAGTEAFGAGDLLRAVLESPMPRAAELFAKLGLDDPLAALFPEGEREPDRAPEADQQAEPEPEAAPEPERRETPALDTYGRDLTRLARAAKLPQLIGRREELRILARVLVRQRKANAVLVGHAGVGKTNIVEGLAARLVAPGAPAGLAGARVVELSMAALVAGTKYRGEFEARVEAVLNEARESPELILFIDELHTVLGAGGKGASNAADILKPALARGELRCVGATTPGEYRRDIEADPALERRFEVIWVDEPTRSEAVEILEKVCATLAAHHGVEIDEDVPAAAIDLTIRHLPELRLPDKAIDIVDQACSTARIETLSPVPAPSPASSPAASPASEPGQRDRATVGSHEVAAAVAARARLPLERVTEGEARRLLRMEEHLRRRVIGQDAAVRVVADAVRTARTGLGDPRRPIGVFLLAGPTGTGKTELAKAVAEFLFGDERRLVRIDMSEYKERYALSRLLGAPPGYVGHDREGQLSGPLRDHPHSVVLFDEVEKAHPEILDVFLQIFDEGQLTDSRGRRVSFTDTVVILTSNLGSGPVGPVPGPRLLGFAPSPRPGDVLEVPEADRAADRVRAALAEALRPELLGRIGRVVVFEPLSRPALRRILDKLVDRVRDRLAARRITLTLTDDACDLVLRQTDGVPSGARALEQAVELLLVQPLGTSLLSGRFHDGSEVVVDGGATDLEFVEGETAR